MKNISILGSTGSIGTQTIEIVRENPDRFHISALAVNRDVDVVEKQVREFKPEMVCVYDEKAAEELKLRIADTNTIVVAGMNGLIECACLDSVDVVLTAVVGMIGIKPTIAAINAGKDIALANKETLVTAGHLIMPLIKEKKVNMYPVDSEHSAIFQSLQGIRYGGSISEGNSQINKIILTASGGPFRGMTREEMRTKTRFDALKHPNWAMGQKITIDSATMVNKGLEMMEAGWLFGVGRNQIDVVIHPQSILHSAVEFVDGAVIGQMGLPDMKLPILYALTYPERIEMKAKKLDFYELSTMTFEKPDKENFKGLALAERAMDEGGNIPTVYNAANEFLVDRFLHDKIGFLDISDYIEMAMDKITRYDSPDLETILATEKETYSFLNNILS